MIFQLEICAFDLDSCITAQLSGAHRIELCDNPYEGGTTPSYGQIRMAREKISIDIYPIIRPHGGDFLYSDSAYSIMKRDVKLCKDLGCNGVVIGVLTRDGTVDKRRVAAIVELAYPMGVTFHRAFDRASNPFKAMEDIIETGCERILTSGQHPTVIEGVRLIKELVEQAGERIIIMPGAGLRSDNVKEIALQTGATEFHTTAKKMILSEMTFVNKDMNEVMERVTCDDKEVRRIVEALENL